MQIFRLHPSHIEWILNLNLEFERYLQSLSSWPRAEFDVEKKREQLIYHAFWKKKSYSGYVAKIDSEIVGYAFYHYGFDPDEMQGKVIHLIDFFVSEKARRKWVGRALIEKLQSHEDSLGLYFWVWKKNVGAIKFYQSLWSERCDDVPFMKLLK
jgi:ribosomal protein S18 acetylase RimI-like enzyme